MLDLDTTTEPPKRRLPKVAVWAFELLIIIGVLQLVGWFQARHLPESGTPAPAVTFTDLEGNPHTLDELKGKQALLHFWATWCSVCKMEHGTLNAVYEDLDEDQALIALVADGDDLRHLKAYISSANIKYPVWIADQAALTAFGVKSFPSNIYLDPQGLLHGGDVGMSSRWGVQARLGCAGTP